MLPSRSLWYLFRRQEAIAADMDERVVRVECIFVIGLLVSWCWEKYPTHKTRLPFTSHTRSC